MTLPAARPESTGVRGVELRGRGLPRPFLLLLFFPCMLSAVSKRVSHQNNIRTRESSTYSSSVTRTSRAVRAKALVRHGAALSASHEREGRLTPTAA